MRYARRVARRLGDYASDVGVDLSTIEQAGADAATPSPVYVPPDSTVYGPTLEQAGKAGVSPYIARPSYSIPPLRPIMNQDQEFYDTVAARTRAAQVLGMGQGGIGIGMILVLVVGAIFLLSHSGRRR